jgi:hypothetical protein
MDNRKKILGLEKLWVRQGASGVLRTDAGLSLRRWLRGWSR